MATMRTQYYPVYFGPDLDPAWMANPGLLVDVANHIPSHRNTLKTHQCAPSQKLGGNNTVFGGHFLNGGIFKNIAGVGRLIVGNTLYLFEFTGGLYTIQKTLAATASGFDFTTYGNHIIAVDKANNPQMSSSSTFADLGGGPPKASCCTTNRNFVVLGDTNDGTNDFGDQVWWSALGNDQSWTVSASTQAGNLRITDTPGPVRALVNMRDSIAVYKDDSVYILDYQGSPLLWTARLISDKAGCASRSGVAVVDGIHYFLHRTGVKRFDGASIQDIGAPVNRYLFSKMVEQVNYASVQAAYDEQENVIMWFFHRDDESDAYDRSYALAYNVVTGKFGFVSAAWTGDGTGNSGNCQGVIDATLADINAWDSAVGTSSGNILLTGVNGSGDSGELRIPVWGTAGQSTASALLVTTGDIGDDVNDTILTRVQPRLIQCDPSFGGGSYGAGGAQQLFAYGKASQSEDYGSGTAFTTSQTKRRFDGMKAARYIKLTVPIYNYGEIAGLYLTTAQAGTE